MANHNEVRQSQAAAEFQDLLQEGQEEKFTQLTTMAPHNKMRQSQAVAELHKTFLPAAQTLVPGKHFPLVSFRSADTNWPSQLTKSTWVYYLYLSTFKKQQRIWQSTIHLSTPNHQQLTFSRARRRTQRGIARIFTEQEDQQRRDKLRPHLTHLA